MQSRDNTPPSTLRLLLWLLFPMATLEYAAAAVPSSCGQRVQFLPLGGCPTEADKARLQPAPWTLSPASCLMLCITGTAGNCTAAAFSPAADGGGGACHLSQSPPASVPPAWPLPANGRQCQAFVRRPTLPDDLSLLCWFSFPFGLANLADAGTAASPCARRAVCVGSGTVCNASGAVLVGSRQSRVEIGATDGLESRLVAGSNFSIFIKAWRIVNSGQNTHYYRLMPSSDNTVVKGFLFETTAKNFELFYSAADVKKYGTSSAPAPTMSTVVSVGMTFSAGAGYQLFVQDRLVSVSAMMSVGFSLLAGDLITLGHEPTVDAACLAGRILCFAISDGSLSLQQLRVLRDGC